MSITQLPPPPYDCVNPRAAAVSCTDRPTDRPTSHQKIHYFNIANAVTHHLSSAEAGRIQMRLC
jgi:hypothetical protein